MKLNPAKEQRITLIIYTSVFLFHFLVLLVLSIIVTDRYRDMTGVAQTIDVMPMFPRNRQEKRNERPRPPESGSQTRDKNDTNTAPVEPSQEDFNNFYSEYVLTSLPRPVGKKIIPAYPSGARQQQVQGTVIILAFFDSQGKLKRYKVTRSMGYGCDEEAVNALRRQVFVPAIKDGKPVPARMYIQYDFRLED